MQRDTYNDKKRRSCSVTKIERNREIVKSGNQEIGKLENWKIGKLENREIGNELKASRINCNHIQWRTANRSDQGRDIQNDTPWVDEGGHLGKLNGGNRDCHVQEA